MRAKVEHPFLYVKRRFGYRKVRYRGLAKNIERIALLLGFANLLVGGPLFDGVSGRRGKHPPTRGATRGSSARTCRFGAFSARHRPQDR